MASSCEVSYNYVKKLGKGAFGSVWECKNKKGDKVVAVKVIPNDEYGIPFLLEMSIMMSYSHPYINRAIHIETASGKTCLIQEKADSDLESVISKEALPQELYHSWAHQLLQGILQLHQQGIIHADVKPENCLIFGDQVRLTDFTISLQKVSPADTFTHPIATIHYRPPEVLQGHHWNEAVDIWGLGCIFYMMATGEQLIPHQGEKLNGELEDDAIRLQLRGKNLSAIAHWRQGLGEKSARRCTLPDPIFIPVKMAKKLGRCAIQV